jgi:Protein of unknown function (DUF551)
MSEWKDIATAPKDGRSILTFAPMTGNGHDGIQVNYWVDKSEHPWGDKWWRSSTLNPPTHWQPMPEPPQ